MQWHQRLQEEYMIDWVAAMLRVAGKLQREKWCQECQFHNDLESQLEDEDDEKKRLQVQLLLHRHDQWKKYWIPSDCTIVLNFEQLQKRLDEKNDYSAKSRTFKSGKEGITAASAFAPTSDIPVDASDNDVSECDDPRPVAIACIEASSIRLSFNDILCKEWKWGRAAHNAT